MVELLFVIYFIVRSVAQAAKDNKKVSNEELSETQKLAARSIVFGVFNVVSFGICVLINWLFFLYIIGDMVTLYRYTNK